MPDIAVLAVFLPTWFFILITQFMCMTLEMTFGMSFVVTWKLWLLTGEAFGVATLSILSVVGVACLLLN